MISIFLAAFCNAIMDTVDHHFLQSVFSLIKGPDSKQKRLWWNEYEGWRNKYINRNQALGLRKIHLFGMCFNYPVQLTDAWHFFKTIMLVFCALGIAEGIFILHFIGSGLMLVRFGTFWCVLICLIAFCASWVLGFNFGYNKVLLRKTWGK